MAALAPWLNAQTCLSDSGYVATSEQDSEAYVALEVLIKGVEAPLPAGESFSDKDGNTRRRIRTKWWDSSARSYRQAAIPDGLIQTDLGNTPESSRFGYPADAKPLFIGHYWFTGEPRPLLPNLACLDYSVAKGSNGKLVCYEHSGEQTLDQQHFIWC